MSSHNQEPTSESATAINLGNLFRDGATWLMEHGTIEIGQILDPSPEDDYAPYYQFAGEVICDLLPKAASRLGITPIDSLHCKFYPPYNEEAFEADEVVTQPPECVFYIDQGNKSVVQAVSFHLELLFTQTEDWLATGRKETDYIRIPLPKELSVEPKLAEEFRLDDMLPRDPISPAECDALQAIADNLDLLKYHQDRRGA